MYNYDVEEIILSMADMVRENRILRAENERLQGIEDKYYQSINDRCRASEESSLNMLKAALVGVATGKSDIELARSVVEAM